MTPTDSSLANWLLVVDGTPFGASDPQSGDATTHLHLDGTPTSHAESFTVGVRPADAQTLSSSVGMQAVLLNHQRQAVTRALIQKVDPEQGLVIARPLPRTLH